MKDRHDIDNPALSQREIEIAAPELAIEKRHVETAHVESREIRVLEDVEQSASYLAKRRGARHVRVTDPVNRGGFGGNRPLGVDPKSFRLAPSVRVDANERDLDDLVAQWIDPGRFEIEKGEGALKHQAHDARKIITRAKATRPLGIPNGRGAPRVLYCGPPL